MGPASAMLPSGSVKYRAGGWPDCCEPCRPKGLLSPSSLMVPDQSPSSGSVEASAVIAEGVKAPQPSRHSNKAGFFVLDMRATQDSGGYAVGLRRRRLVPV